jgi:hypothetical protein
MLSITLKRSAATLGVMAGLLAAAAPANALPAVSNQQPVDALVRTPIDDLDLSIRGDARVNGYIASDPSSEVDNSIILAGTADDQMRHTGSKAPRASSVEVAMESVTQLNDVEAVDFNALGTQVGSEGLMSLGDGLTHEGGFVKAPTAGTETGNPERSGPALASSRAGAFALELEGKIVKAPASPTSVVFTSVSNVAVATAVVGGIVPGGAIVSA